jgi:hypothetical protein
VQLEANAEIHKLIAKNPGDALVLAGRAVAPLPGVSMDQLAVITGTCLFPYVLLASCHSRVSDWLYRLLAFNVMCFDCKIS